MAQGILVLNSGSSSIKFSIFTCGDKPDALELLYKGFIEGIGTKPRFSASDADGNVLNDNDLHPDDSDTFDHESALSLLGEWIEKNVTGLKLVAAGHRVVHGGVLFSMPVLINPTIVGQLEELIPLAPLHQPHNLTAIKVLLKLKPDMPQVACFDTAFHQTQPHIARTFALPRRMTEEGIKRYGFHGLSYEYIAGVLPDYMGDAAYGRVVVAHLGNGASMCAIKDGKSTATTMGFTALDGLPMGTRSGTLDPGILLYLLSEKAMDFSGLNDLLYYKSGLLGVSGISSDMRELLNSDNPRAQEAVDLFVYRIGRELGSLTAALGGLDILVFTAGIGENAAPVRAKVCEQARWLGVRLEESANLKGGPRISRDDSEVSVWVIPTDEEKIIAQDTYKLTAE
jgi:acetate kinase